MSKVSAQMVTITAVTNLKQHFETIHATNDIHLNFLMEKKRIFFVQD